MSRIRPSATAERQAEQAWQAYRIHHLRATRTATGREADALRTQGHLLAAANNQAGAHDRFVAAMELFSPGDTGAAAAAAQYDLAESFKNLRSGARRANLLEAQRLLEQSLTSQERREDPVRLALSHDNLGQVLRRLALETDDVKEQERLRRSAVLQIAKACGLAEAIGCLGWRPAAAYYNNLGNALRQLGLFQDSIDAYRRALDFADAATRHPDWDLLDVHAPLSLYQRNLACGLLARDGDGDASRAVSLLQQALRANVGDRDRLLMTLAEAQVQAGDSPGGAATARAIRVEALHVHGQIAVGQLLAAHGSAQEGLRVLATARHAAMVRRSEAMSDTLADERIRDVQSIAVVEASLHLERKEAVDAFLVLENSTGLRYFDAVSRYAQPPVGPVDALLRARLEATSLCAGQAEDLAARSAHAESAPELLEESLRYFVANLIHYDRFASPPILAMIEALQQAATQVSPSAHLNRVAERLRQDAHRLLGILAERLPAPTEAWSNGLTISRLEALLARNTDTVFAHLHLGPQGLLVAAVWHGGAVVENLEVPSLEPLFALARGEDPDSERLDSLLAALDLSTVLEPAAKSRLVVLPSLLASLVPWAAAGTTGSRLVEHFKAISVLPILTPLEDRQAPSTPRAGAALVIPGDHPVGHGTRFHALAFSEPLPEETRLLEQDATVEAAAELAIGSDVITFYAHGNREVGPGVVELADGPFSPMHALGGTFHSCERVELWACDSGVNMPHDPLSALVDEAFGLDIEFHRAGARSTIGTLWSVNDFTTACIVRRYRRALGEGEHADVALCTAQRWWIQEAVPTFAKAAREGGVDRAALVLEGLGGVLGPDLCQAALGPAPSESTSDEAANLVTLFASPSSWGGFRFVGVCEHRPTEPWLDDYGRAPTPEERAEAERIFLVGPSEGRTVDHYLEDWLSGVRESVVDERPTPHQAVEMGRLFALRRVGKARNNLLRGLAWVCEGLTTAKGDDVERLSTEAAWLWVTLARGEVVHEVHRAAFAVEPQFVARARRALVRAATPEGSILQAWLDHLEGNQPPVFETLLSALDTLEVGSLERVRAAAEIGALRLAYPNGGDLVERLTAERAKPGPVAPVWLWGQRLDHAIAMLQHEAGVTARFPDWSVLDHARCARQLIAITTTSGGPGRSEEAPLALQALNACSAVLEGDLWGWDGEGPAPAWSSTGTPGLAWREALAPYLAGQLNRPSVDTHTHFLASVHMGAELRLGPMNLWARTFGSQSAAGSPWSLAQQREAILSTLFDAARLARPSPFDAGASELVRLADEDPLALTSWSMATALLPISTGRTAAFEAEAVLHRNELGIHAFCENIATLGEQEAALFTGWMTPRHRLADVQRWVEHLPPHRIVLGAQLGPAGTLLMSSVYQAPEGPQHRHFVSTPGLGFRIAVLLSHLVHPQSDDAYDGNRNDLIAELRDLMSEPMQATLAHLPTSPPNPLVVLAPGPMRSMPWLSLTVAGKPTWRLFSAVSSMPHVGFEQSTAWPSGTMVLSIAGAGTDQDSFGTRALLTLRRNHPCIAAEPSHPSGTDLPEVRAIDQHADELGVLSFYGSESPLTVNGSTEVLSLTHGRSFGVDNHAETPLPRCQLVELWTSVGRLGEADAIRSLDVDVMPRMVHRMLASGAIGVVDLAWPCHDLVKALVFEFHGHLRAQPDLVGGMALRLAVAYVHDMLEQIRQRAHPLSTVAQVLAALDHLRTIHLVDWGGPVPEEGRFEPLHGSIHTTAADLIAEITRPCHLAAFRYWGA